MHGLLKATPCDRSLRSTGKSDENPAMTGRGPTPPAPQTRRWREWNSAALRGERRGYLGGYGRGCRNRHGANCHWRRTAGHGGLGRAVVCEAGERRTTTKQLRRQRWNLPAPRKDGRKPAVAEADRIRQREGDVPRRVRCLLCRQQPPGEHVPVRHETTSIGRGPLPTRLQNVFQSWRATPADRAAASRSQSLRD